MRGSVNHYSHCRLRIKLSYDLAIPLLDVSLKGSMSTYHRNNCISMHTAAVFTVASKWNQLQDSSADESVKKLWCIYTVFFFQL